MKSHPIPQNKRSARDAFTLIELLVVIAIIAILAAVTIPLAKIVGDSSKSARSIDNLKTIGTVLTSYANDHNDLYPVVESDEEFDWTDLESEIEIKMDDLETLPHWTRALVHYGAENDTVIAKSLRCPGLDWRDGGDKRIPFDDILLAYGATEGLFGVDEDGQPDNTLARSRLKFENKAQTLLMVETKQNGTRPMSFGEVTWSDAKRDLTRPEPDDATTVDFRFKNAFNALMADGSTRSFRHKERKEVEEPHWSGLDYDRIR